MESRCLVQRKTRVRLAALGMDAVNRSMIRGIHHLGLTVRDVDASAAWYEEVLGFRRVGEFTGARRGTPQGVSPA